MALRARYEALDTLRALLILGVMCFHFLRRWQQPWFPHNLALLQDHYSDWLDFGAYGVELFFVISGVVIALTASRAEGSRHFLFLRASRIYPTYALCIVLTFFVLVGLGPEEIRPSPGDIVASLLFLPSLFEGVRYVDGVYWSLAVEFKFYLMVAAGLWLFGQRFWIGILLVAIIGYAASLFSLGVADKLLIFRQMPFFLIGMALYELRFEESRARAMMLGGAGVLLFWLTSDGGTDAAIVFAAVIGLAAIVLSGVRFGNALTATLGRASYAIYLLHEFIGLVAIRALKSIGAPDLIAMAVAAGLVVALGLVVFRGFEVPVQDWLREHYRGRHQGRIDAASPLATEPE